MSSYTAILKQDGDWWIGWVEEVPGFNGQERTPYADALLMPRAPSAIIVDAGREFSERQIKPQIANRNVLVSQPRFAFTSIVILLASASRLAQTIATQIARAKTC